MKYLVVLLVGLAVFLLIVQVFGSALAGREALLARLRRAEEAGKLRNNDDDLFYENVPFFQRVVEPFVNSMIQAVGRTISLSAKEQSKLENDLAQAGIRMRTRDYAAMRLMIIALFTLVCTYYGYVMYKTLTAALLGVLLGLYMGYTVMRFALASRITRRRADMLRQLPNFLDLLSVCVEAGLGFDQGVGHVVRQFPGPLSEEFAVMLRDITLGGTRKDALAALSARTGLEELKTFAAAVVQADEMGISLKNILNVQAASTRQNHKNRIEEQAQKLSVKILFPIIVFIFPVIFIVLLGPAVPKIMEAIK